MTRIFIFMLGLATFCNAAKILYVIPFTSKSHYIMLRPIGLELARKGHNVTVITAIKEDNAPKNYRQVLVDNKEIWEVIGGKRPNVFTMVDITVEEFHNKIFWLAGSAFTEVVLNSSDVQNFLKEDNSFDLVIAEQFFQEALYVLSYKYKAPLALVTTFGNCMRHNILTGNPLQLNTVVSEFLDVRDMTSFWGRLRNMYFAVYEYMWWKYWYMSKQEGLVEKYIPDLPRPVPRLTEIQKNASLFLINSHFSVDPPVAYLPNIVEIGGIHLSKGEGKLPEDIQKILDESQNGIVYMNFGSNVRSSELPEDKKRAFINVFRKLNQTVLWKWEDDKLDGRPDNLAIRKWLPQKEILDLKDPVPSLFEMQKYISLLFINTHFSFDTPIALLPNVIEIGGIHTTQKNNMSLPQDLQNILDNATNGVVYMNFGSNVRISEMDEIKKTAIFNVFRTLNQTVLMKWEVDILENIPDNVIARKWFPQRDLFAHPNIRVFISHGGLIGTQEAIFHGIPILGVPIYADQYNNLDLANKHGFGKIVEFHNICEKTFGEALNEMLANKTYKENAEKMSKRFKDRPMSPLDTTIWWMEYVIRNNGAHFMKSPTINMGWFKYFMLDIYLVVLTTVMILIYFVVASFKIVRALSKFIRSKIRIVKKKRL